MLPITAMKFLSLLLLLLAVSLLGCSGTMQEVKQEIQDESRGTMERMRRGETSYQKREYLGLTSDNSDNWNSTDWTMWMDGQGGGR